MNVNWFEVEEKNLNVLLGFASWNFDVLVKQNLPFPLGLSLRARCALAISNTNFKMEFMVRQL